MSNSPKLRPHQKQIEFLASDQREVFYGGSRGGGKAQPLDSLVLTPFGFRKMGDISVGDMVCNPDGSVANVIQIHPQGIKSVYRITMSDGGKCEATEDHLWLATVSNKTSKRNGIKDNHYKIYATKTLKRYLNTAYSERHYPLIPFTNPVKFTAPNRYEKFDPYYIGLLLGDGYIGNDRIGITSDDVEIITYISRLYDNHGYKYTINKKTGTTAIDITSYDISLRNKLKKCGIENARSINKKIPHRYLYGNEKTRTDILRGLMDTDGTSDTRGHCSFSSISEELADGVMFLLRSLGYAGTKTRSKSGYRSKDEYVQCNDCFDIYITGNNKQNLFNLNRKKTRCRKYNGGSHEQKRRISSITYMREAECQCITVDNPNGLYITDDFIVTHNSWVLAYDAALHYRGKDTNGDIKVSIHYPDYTALLIRRKFVDIQMNFKPICDSIYKEIGGVWKERDRTYHFPSGAKIILAHLDTFSDVDKYIGGNYTYLGIEEANQFPWSWLEKLYPSVRSTNKKLTPYIRMTSNPGGVGHLWLRKRFYDVCTPVEKGKVYSKDFDIEYPVFKSGKTYKDDENNSRKFIPALVFDNPALVENDPQYVRGLKAIKDPVLRAMWLLGSWDVQTGAFFEEWNPLYHVISAKSFKLEKNECRIYRAIDYGSTNPFVCLFVQIDKDGYAIVFDEIYMAGLVPSVQAQMILDKSREWGLSEEDFDLTICDPAMKQRHHEYLGDRVSVVQLYLNEGMQNIHFGNNDRIPGWQILREYLHIPNYVEGDEKASIPMLRFTDNCEHCIESFPNAVRSLKNPEDVDTLCDDHALDSARYLFRFIDKPHRREEPTKKGWRDRIAENSKKRGSDSGDLVWCS